jgi:hypothetical protein
MISCIFCVNDRSATRAASTRRPGFNRRTSLVALIRRGGAVARLAALDINDRAEAALKRAAASSIEARVACSVAEHDIAWQERQCRRRHVRHILEFIVDRFELAAVDVTQEVGHAALTFSGIKCDTEIERFLQIRRQCRQHCNAPARMEAADDDGDIGCPELTREIECARELIGLDTDQTDKPGSCRPDMADCPCDIDNSVALIAAVDVDLDFGPKHLRDGTFRQQAVQTRKAVGGYARAPPLNDITVAIVMRMV